MLTDEDIQEVLDKFKKLEQMRSTKQKNEGRTGVSTLFLMISQAFLGCITNNSLI